MQFKMFVAFEGPGRLSVQSDLLKVVDWGLVDIVDDKWVKATKAARSAAVFLSAGRHLYSQCWSAVSAAHHVFKRGEF